MDVVRSCQTGFPFFRLQRNSYGGLMKWGAYEMEGL